MGEYDDDVESRNRKKLSRIGFISRECAKFEYIHVLPPAGSTDRYLTSVMFPIYLQVKEMHNPLTFTVFSEFNIRVNSVHCIQ